MKKRRNFISEALKEKSLKVLTDDTKLPYVFDLLWDAKEGSDLKRLGLTRNPKVHRCLAEAGFDVKEWLIVNRLKD